MFIIKELLTALVLPPAGLLIPGFLGLWLIVRNKGKQKVAGIAILSLSLTALFLLSLPAVGKRLLAPLEQSPPVSVEQIASAQAIVVLGGGSYFGAPEYGGDTVNFYTLERLRYAARLARAGQLPLLVTGGAPQNGMAEAQAMRELLTQEYGLAVRWTESAARDSAENASFSAPLLKAAGIKRILLVSHAWHLPRAIPLFEREGFTVIPGPTIYSTATPKPLSDWLPHDFRYSRIALREYLGRLVDALKQLF